MTEATTSTPSLPYTISTTSIILEGESYPSVEVTVSMDELQTLVEQQAAEIRDLKLRLAIQEERLTVQDEKLRSHAVSCASEKASTEITDDSDSDSGVFSGLEGEIENEEEVEETEGKRGESHSTPSDVDLQTEQYRVGDDYFRMEAAIKAPGGLFSVHKTIDEWLTLEKEIKGKMHRLLALKNQENRALRKSLTIYEHEYAQEDPTLVLDEFEEEDPILRLCPEIIFESNSDGDVISTNLSSSLVDDSLDIWDEIDSTEKQKTGEEMCQMIDYFEDLEQWRQDGIPTLEATRMREI